MPSSPQKIRRRVCMRLPAAPPRRALGVEAPARGLVRGRPRGGFNASCRPSSCPSWPSCPCRPCPCRCRTRSSGSVGLPPWCPSTDQRSGDRAPRPLPSPARGASSAAEARPAGESRIASRPPASPSNRSSAARRAVGEAATAASYYSTSEKTNNITCAMRVRRSAEAYPTKHGVRVSASCSREAPQHALETQLPASSSLTRAAAASRAVPCGSGHWW